MMGSQTPDDMRAAIERIVLDGILNTDIRQGKTKPLTFSFPKTNIDKLEALLKQAIAAERLRIEAALPKPKEFNEFDNYDDWKSVADGFNDCLDKAKQAINNQQSKDSRG